LTKSLDNHKTIKIQKIVRAQGEYAKKGEDIKDGDIVTINDAGQIVTGDYGDRMVFKISTRNGEKNLSFNQKSLNNLIDSYGEDSEGWKGKEAKIHMVKAMVSGKFQNIVYLAHPSWFMSDDGSFHAPNQPKEENVDLSDIPF